jgi:acetolactate synthase-1/2/3 large subunit
MAPQRWNPDGDKTIVHIDTKPAEVYSKYQPQVEAVGNISASVRALVEALDETLWDDDSWYAPVRRRILDDIAAYELAEGDAFTIPGTLNLIRKHLADDGLLISDVGSHKMWIARNFPTYCASGCLISNGLASMALALPGGIAASLHIPGRQVVGVMGDGGFLMNVQELETAHRLGVTCTYVVVNDNDYGLIRWNQERHRGHSFGTDLVNPDFAALAAAFGIQTYTPQTVAELDAQLAQAITSDELNLVVVPVDATVNNALDQKLTQYWQAQA